MLETTAGLSMSNSKLKNIPRRETEFRGAPLKDILAESWDVIIETIYLFRVSLLASVCPVPVGKVTLKL